MRNVIVVAGSVLGALGASACCWIPAFIGAGAAGSLGLSAALAPWRPYLLILTGLFLAGGFYLAYRRPSEACCEVAPGMPLTPARKRRMNIGVMWAVALFSSAVSAYPYVAATRIGAASAPPALTPDVVLRVAGSDCPACAEGIRANLEKAPGVVGVSVEVVGDAATFSVRGAELSEETLIAAAGRAGFRAEVIPPSASHGDRAERRTR